MVILRKCQRCKDGDHTECDPMPDCSCPCCGSLSHYEKRAKEINEDDNDNRHFDIDQMKTLRKKFTPALMRSLQLEWPMLDWNVELDLIDSNFIISAEKDEWESEILKISIPGENLDARFMHDMVINVKNKIWQKYIEYCAKELKEGLEAIEFSKICS